MQTDSHIITYVVSPKKDSQASTNLRSGKDHSPNDSSSSVETSNTSSHSFNIPQNKGSKRYSIEEVFNVWYEVKDQVLNQNPASKSHENYKHSVPKEIYHLSLQNQAQGGFLIQPIAVDSPQKDHHRLQGQSHTSELQQGQNVSLEDQMAQMSLGKKSAPPPNLAPPDRPQAADPNLVLPENIFWLYLDPSGNEQGPFSGTVMQEWLTDGYLDFELRIRRAEEQNFYTLKQFCEGVNNFVLPFKVPLPDLKASQVPPNFQASREPHLHEEPINSQAPNGNTQQGQSAFNSGTNLYSSLLPNSGTLSLGAASMRMGASNNLFDFMGSRDYLLMNQLNQFSNSQFGIDPVGMNLGQNLGPNLGSNLGQNLGNLGQNLTGSFGQLHMPSLLQQQLSQQQQPSLSRNNSGWGLNSGSGLMAAGPQTPSAVNTNLSGLGNQGPSSPWISGMQSISRVSSPFVPSSSLTGSASAEESDIGKITNEDPVLHDIHSSMVTGILNDDDHRRPSLDEQPQPAKQAEPVPEDPTMPGAFVDVPEEKETTEESEAQAARDFKESVEKSIRESNPEPKVQAPAEKITKNEAKAETQPALAPWAKNSGANTEPPKPAMTLKEIQALEAARLREEQQLKAEKRQQIALANAIASSKEEVVAEKPTFNWASKPSQPVVGKKSLAEIQREEAEAAKSKAAAAKVATAPKASLASSLAASAPKEEKSWTTVVGKKATPTQKPVSTPASYAASVGGSNTISPQMLRAASSTNTNSSSINGNAVREDFLIWARSAMTNLYPSVSKNDLLEIFTTLPLHPDSSQLISETIYSSSATMDGRRFAQEFMKRRLAVEKQVGAGNSDLWSSAIALSADKVPIVDDEGWSTSGKNKKKGRKN